MPFYLFDGDRKGKRKRKGGCGVSPRKKRLESHHAVTVIDLPEEPVGRRERVDESISSISSQGGEKKGKRKSKMKKTVRGGGKRSGTVRKTCKGTNQMCLYSERCPEEKRKGGGGS